MPCSIEVREGPSNYGVWQVILLRKLGRGGKYSGLFGLGDGRGWLGLFGLGLSHLLSAGSAWAWKAENEISLDTF